VLVPGIEGWVRLPAITRWSQRRSRACWRSWMSWNSGVGAVLEVPDEGVPVALDAQPRRYRSERPCVPGRAGPVPGFDPAHHPGWLPRVFPRRTSGPGSRGQSHVWVPRLPRVSCLR